MSAVPHLENRWQGAYPPPTPPYGGGRDYADERPPLRQPRGHGARAEYSRGEASRADVQRQGPLGDYGVFDKYCRPAKVHGRPAAEPPTRGHERHERGGRTDGGRADGGKWGALLSLGSVPSDWDEEALMYFQTSAGVSATTIKGVKLLAQQRSNVGLRTAIVTYSSPDAAYRALELIQGRRVERSDGTWHPIAAKFAEGGAGGQPTEKAERSWGDDDWGGAEWSWEGWSERQGGWGESSYEQRSWDTDGHGSRHQSHGSGAARGREKPRSRNHVDDFEIQMCIGGGGSWEDTLRAKGKGRDVETEARPKAKGGQASETDARGKGKGGHTVERGGYAVAGGRHADEYAFETDARSKGKGGHAAERGGYAVAGGRYADDKGGQGRAVEKGGGSEKGGKSSGGKGRRRTGAEDPDVAKRALDEVAQLLREPGCEGRVWIPNWNGRYQAKLGHMRDFLESHPDRFRIVSEMGKTRRYLVEFVDPAEAGYDEDWDAGGAHAKAAARPGPKKWTPKAPAPE